MQKRSTKIRRAITFVITAEIADSWKGAGDPADIPEIESRLALARRRLDAELDALELEERSKEKKPK